MKLNGSRVILGVVCAVMASTFFVSAARAEEREVIERKVFYLDWGFIGHPVSLDLNGGKTRVSWDTGDLTAPTMLMVEIEREPAVNSPSGVTFGDEVVHLTWADPYLLSARGVSITNQDGCTKGEWNTCALYREENGTWKEASDSRGYGHIRVRMGTKKANYMQAGTASWYKYKNCRCAASPDFPKGTRLRVRSVADPSKYTVIKVNDFGPDRKRLPERVIDLDAVAFKELAPLGAGVIKVTVEPVAETDPDYKMADSLPTGTTAPVAKVAAPVVKTEPLVAEPTWNY